ncbi:twin-arginine translocase subunit TatC [Pirellulales bacterium]|nr:twin-arginine translocase subunit TatC [Pirellulales bacterium]
MHEPEDANHLERSKMSFGQHLEELRAALVKSFLALFLGFLVGLACGRWIVNQIQTPLRDALHAHFNERAVEKELVRLQERKDRGEKVPDDLEAAAREFAELELEPGELYLSPRKLAEQLNALQPGIVDPESFPPPSDDGSIRKEDLIRISVYQPLSENSRLRLVALSAEEPFMVFLKASLAAGVMFASPLIFFFIWDFVAAGLYRQERKYVYMYLPISLGLFFSGAALAFFVAFDYVLDFLFQFYAWTGTDPSPRLSEWISFVLMLPLGFGISFQLPLVMLLLERLGVFTVQVYLNKWRVAVLVIAIISMFLTPADPGSMIVMATPLVVLYFGGILLCRYMPGTGPKVDKRAAT